MGLEDIKGMVDKAEKTAKNLEDKAKKAGVSDKDIDKAKDKAIDAAKDLIKGKK